MATAWRIAVAVDDVDANEPSMSLATLLADGWEPFALGPPSVDGFVIVYLRTQDATLPAHHDVATTRTPRAT